MTIFPPAALGASSAASPSLSLSCSYTNQIEPTAVRGTTYLAGNSDWLEVDVLSDDGSLSVESSRLSLVLSESVRSVHVRLKEIDRLTLSMTSSRRQRG